MNDIHCKPKKGRPRRPSLEMALYIRQIAADNTDEHSRLKRNLIRAIKTELTPRQRQMMLMYYKEDMSMTGIARKLDLNVSTVYRTIKRGEARLRKILKYSSSSTLASFYGD